jgi:hypothetical protein
MSSQKKGQPGVHEGPLVQMIDCQRVQQAAADAAKKLVDAEVIAARKLADVTKESEETTTDALSTAALSVSEAAQVSLRGSTARRPAALRACI